MEGDECGVMIQPASLLSLSLSLSILKSMVMICAINSLSLSPSLSPLLSSSDFFSTSRIE